jgi:hypothetical protein
MDAPTAVICCAVCERYAAVQSSNRDWSCADPALNTSREAANSSPRTTTKWSDDHATSPRKGLVADQPPTAILDSISRGGTTAAPAAFLEISR